MLIEFKVTNHRSILHTQTLNLVANKSKELIEENTVKVKTPGGLRLLRSAVIYGPNAAGKTSLLEAIFFVKDYILNSAGKTQFGDKILTTPFLFKNKAQSQKPSQYEITFILKGKTYQYGFSVSSKRVIHERLLVYPKISGRSQRWFERTYNPKKNRDDWYIGPNFKGHNKILKQATRANALFLSTAVQLNNKQLFSIFNWFNFYFFAFSSIHNLNESLTAEFCEQKDIKKIIIQFLKLTDPTICDIRFDTDIFYLENPKNAFTSRYIDDLEESEITQITIIHKTKNLKKVELNLNDESDGTQKLFKIVPLVLTILSSGGVLALDELDNSIHPSMVRFLVLLFNNPLLNQKNAQLIFATHDTSILDSKLFRRDQIWFAEKDKENSTQIYPLSDFSVRQGEALEKNYLQGRYGAIPYIGDFPF